MATKGEKIKALLAKGMKPKEIAQKLKCDWRYVYTVKAGKKRKYTKRVKVEKTDSMGVDLLAKLRKHQADIATAIGVLEALG